MRRDRFNAPLTDAEREFAAAHHYLIAKYLRKRRLPIDDWYDIVAFRYCRSVKHKHSFEIIAFYAMRSAIGHEYEKRKRRIRTVSLEDKIPGADHLRYGDIATEDHRFYR